MNKSNNLVELVTTHCKNKLNLANASLSNEYFYNSLPLCVIDAIFSIGITYTATRNVVINFCNKANITRLRTNGSSYPEQKDQFSISDLLNLYNTYDIEQMANELFCNKCRTSSTNGILKSEAVKLFCEILKKYNVNYFQDLHKVISNDKFEKEIKNIPGQRSGISTSYFYMLAGGEKFIKPDRMLVRFVESCTNTRNLNANEVNEILTASHRELIKDYPSLTLRELDHEIWKMEKQSKS